MWRVLCVFDSFLCVWVWLFLFYFCVSGPVCCGCIWGLFAVLPCDYFSKYAHITKPTLLTSSTAPSSALWVPINLRQSHVETVIYSMWTLSTGKYKQPTDPIFPSSPNAIYGIIWIFLTELKPTCILHYISICICIYGLFINVW